ncbi:hypothetical protein BDZ97DRAFT_1787780 [Flammula alnicola]|nr:hypothetical protein BDZ97DRAFT_1787780 [Flammula alnicola]
MCALPPELPNYIINLFADDREALDNCVLVSWYFLPASRKHIFHPIVLRASHLRHLFHLLSDQTTFACGNRVIEEQVADSPKEKYSTSRGE